MNFISKLENGKINPSVAKQITGHLSKMKVERIVITIDEWKSKRSLAQNRLYHKWVGEIADQTGADREAMHEYLKRRFLGIDTKEVLGGYG